jgi:hypothetical protein
VPVVQPPKPRYRIEDLGDGLKITVPSHKSWIGSVVVGIYTILLWSLPIGFVASMFSEPAQPGPSTDAAELLILVPFGLLFMVLILLVTYVFLWSLFGVEIILIRPGSLAARRQMLSLGRTREYLAEHIRDLRVQPPANWPGHVEWMSPFTGIAKGPITFDYGAKTFHIGSGAEEAEAKQILAAIQQRFPQYRHTEASQ